MFCPKRDTSYVESPVRSIRFTDLSVSEFYQPSSIDSFSFVSSKTPGSSVESVCITSDISMLLNQKRLDNLSSQALLQHFSAMAQSNSSFSEVRSKLGDNELIKFVKSRYIQSPSELMSYSAYLLSEYEGSAAVAAAAASAAAASAAAASAAGNGDPLPPSGASE